MKRRKRLLKTKLISDALAHMKKMKKMKKILAGAEAEAYLILVPFLSYISSPRPDPR